MKLNNKLLSEIQKCTAKLSEYKKPSTIHTPESLIKENKNIKMLFGLKVKVDYSMKPDTFYIT